MRLAIVTTHPIQYNAPWFRLLSQQSGITVRVFYTWEQSQQSEIYDPGFQKVRSWDIPLLEGYDYVFVKNISPNQGSHHFKGIDNPTLVQDIKAWKADAVLVFGWPFKSHLACIKYFKGKIPVLFRGDSTMLDETSGIKKIIRRLLLRYVYSFVDYAVYVGQNNKQYYLAHGLKEKQLMFTPHAIDNERFEQPADKYEAAAKEWRQQLGIAAGEFVVLFAGKLEPKKNPAFIIALAQQLAADNIKFVIVGNGPMEAELKQQAAGDKRVVFLDFQNQQQMPVVYRLADVFVLPSNGPGETWGLALNEAMACKRPVIATTRVGGAIDLINGNGIIINPGDVNAAAGYIDTLVTDKNKYNKAAQKSYDIVQAFSFGKIVESITQLSSAIKHAGN